MLVNFHTEAVSGFLDVGGQVEVRRGKGVFTKANELAVQPDVECFFHTLEADADSLSFQRRIQVKIPDVASYGVVVPVNHGRAKMGMAVPGIELVDILDLPVTLQFHVPGDLNGIKSGGIKILLPKPGGAFGGCTAPMEQPLSV